VAKDPGPVEKPLAVLFDIDETLVHTGGAGARSWKVAFDKLYGVVQSVGRLTTPARRNFGGPQSAPAENVLSRQTTAEQRGLGNPDVLFGHSQQSRERLPGGSSRRQPNLHRPRRLSRSKPIETTLSRSVPALTNHRTSGLAGVRRRGRGHRRSRDRLRCRFWTPY